MAAPERTPHGLIAPRAPNVRHRAASPGASGNQSHLRRLAVGGQPLQARLTIGAVDDPLEQEADAAADRVMRMAKPQVSLSSAPTLSRKCAACEEGEEKGQPPLRRAAAAAGGTDAAAAPPIVHDVLNSPGRPLDPATHDFMASRFGTDFSHVRIHTDARAAESAKSVGALAYTVGADIVFGAGTYAPGAESGRRLLAHELAHTVQQEAGTALRRKPDLAGCLAQKDDILPPNVGLVTAIAREQELADALGADYEPFKQLILKRVDARILVCQHGVPGVLALWHARTVQSIIDVPAATAMLSGGVAPPAPAPTAVPAITPTPGVDDFQIKRVGWSTSSRLLFARGSDAINPSAQMQIDLLKASPPSGSIRLIGYSSADEAAALAQSRADAAKTAFASAPNALAISSATGNAAANASKIDFVTSRGVDVVIGTAAPTTVDCDEKKDGKLVHPPTQPCPMMDPATETKFKEAHKLATDVMADAVAAVAGSPPAADSAKIDRFFGGHDAATLGLLQTNLGALNTHVINLPAETDCGGECDKGLCADGPIAYNNGKPAASRTTICVPTFKELSSDSDRARNLIHETAHGTSPLGGAPGTGTKDYAYRHERMLLELPSADRLHNSDSYALFALFVHEAKTTHDPNAVPKGIRTPENDKLNGFTPIDPETPALKLALAKMEKRLTWSQDRVAQLYGQVVNIRAPAGPGKPAKTWADSWAKGLMTEAAKHFPLTPTSSPPTLADQIRIAAMEDRYLRMYMISKNDLVVTRAATGTVTWASPAAGSPFLAGASLSIGPDFFRADPEDQVSLLLESVAGQTKDLEPAFVPAYASLAKWIHQNA
jgi:hypothetical protein